MLELATWNWTEAERALEHAIQLNPSSSRAHEAYAWFLSAMGRHEEAIDRARQAVQLNPLDLGARTLVARFHFYARDYDRAIEEARSVLEIDPDFVAAYTVIEWAQVQQGAYDSAVSTKREELERMGLNPKELASLDKAYQDGGVERYWQWKLELILDKAYYRSSVNEVIAGHYVRMGEFDRGFEHLLKAYEERELFLFLLNVNPWWDPVRDDLRFQDIISRLNYPPA
jgi:tetratricopeptide (TPR) repeat protein